MRFRIDDVIRERPSGMGVVTFSRAFGNGEVRRGQRVHRISILTLDLVSGLTFCLLPPPSVVMMVSLGSGARFTLDYSLHIAIFSDKRLHQIDGIIKLRNELGNPA
jgi:hypothetical protein